MHGLRCPGLQIFFFFFPLEKVAGVFIALGVHSGALGGVGPLPLHCHGLLAVQDGAGFADGGHVQVWAVLVLVDQVPDAVEGGLCIPVDGGLHVGGGQLSRARSLLREHHAPAVHIRLHALVVNESAVVEGVVGLQIVGFGAIHLLVPPDQEAGAEHTTIHCRCVDVVAAPFATAAG